MRRDPRRRQRGAIYVEALVIIPVLTTLWIILLFIERGNTVDNEVVERGRHDVWRTAVDECRGAGGEQLAGPEVDGAAGGALSRLASLFPFLASEWHDPHGSIVRVSARDSLARPLGWGSIQVESHQTWMCQTRKRRWRDALVFGATCLWYSLEWCSAGGVGGLDSSVAPRTQIPIDGSAPARLDQFRRTR